MILCCGDALIDMLPRRLPCGEQAYLPAVGGAIFNTAIGLGRLGGISLASEPCGSAYEPLGLREQSKRVIALNPNVRPAFASSRTAYRDRLEGLIAVADIAKISGEDLAWLAPGRGFDDVAGEWLAGATSLVVTTLGAGSGARAGAKGGGRDRVEGRRQPAVGA